MIPKIIHYCWFGLKPKPKKFLYCIDSWKKMFPDYDFIEWNENKFDVYSHPFVKEAYEKQKFAFVSDYVRIYALSKYGGIYLDTDVEVCKSFDLLLKYRCFVSIEPDTNLISTCCIGMEKKHPLTEVILQYYDIAKVNNVPNTVLLCNIFKERYNNFDATDKEYDWNEIHIFPSSFVALSKKYKNNFIIHYLSATWLSPWGKIKQKLILLMRKNNFLYKNYKRIKGGGKKIFFHLMKFIIAILNHLNTRIAMSLYIFTLRICGVNIKGNPRFISTRIRIDDFTLITIGHQSVISENVTLLTHDYSCTNALRTICEEFKTDLSKHAPIMIGSNVFIGMGSIILPGTFIDDNVIIGAGTVVKGHLQKNMIYIGNPAKAIKPISDYASKVKDEMSNGRYEYRFD